MKESNFNLRDRVKVSALLVGFGEPKYGEVVDVYEFMSATYVEVKYDTPSPDGRLGCTVTNLGLLEKVS